jgi:serine/threonine protein kinase
LTSIPPRPRLTSRYYAPGEVIAGKYELVRPLGEGGMGCVWLAHNRALDASVALKVLRADLEAEDAAERLMQEARAAARIGHRAIVRVFDFGHTEQGDPFIVMELLEGESLADVLSSRGRLSPIKAVQMLLPVVDALAAAHARGIIHRDLKPDNIFLVREQRRTQPKVVDFGIAKVEQQTGPARTLTRQGTVLGSPGYMSPEQARGLMGVDHRTDVWSVCVVLYECITGRPAFEGDNYNALMVAIIQDRVVPSVELAAGDAALWEILERGLRKAPGERWASMREFGAALAGWLISHGIDQDVCGEPLNGMLDVSESGPRDILSVPPPSRVTTGRTSSPGASATLNRGPEGDSQASSSTPVGKLPSFRPGPESTSAVVQSARASVIQRAPLAIGGGVVALGLVLTLFLVGRSGTPEPGPAAGSAGTQGLRPPAPAIRLAAPQPAPSAAALPAIAAPTAGAAPPTLAKEKETKAPAKKSKLAQPAAVRAGPRRAPSVAPSDPSDLKDPY